MDTKNNSAKARTGACCVCGEATRNRCGACEAAGFDLFFCSKEHQKLVWFNHKRVCGSRSNPFILPPLTQAEAQAAKDNLRRVHHDTPQNCPNSIRQLFEAFVPREMRGFSDEFCYAALDRYTDASKVDGTEIGLNEVRRLSWMRTWESGPGTPRAAFDSLANFESGLMSIPYGSEEAAKQEVPLPWMSPLRHKALIFYTLLELSHNPSRYPGFSRQFILHAYEALLRHIDQDVAVAAGTETARKVRAQLDEVFHPLLVRHWG